jgi:MerR family copper efflux transcriptional regulator
MLIGEIAKKTGLTRDTVRFYEREGLIASGEQEAGSRIYKTFDQEALERLLFIKQGQAGGFTLREIKEILNSWGTNLNLMPRDQMVASLEVKLRQTEEKIERLENVRAYLSAKLERARAGEPMAKVDVTAC